MNAFHQSPPPIVARKALLAAVRAFGAPQTAIEQVPIQFRESLPRETFDIAGALAAAAVAEGPQERRPIPRAVREIKGISTASEFRPKTELGQKLWALRMAILESGAPELDWDDLERELADRRGIRE